MIASEPELFSSYFRPTETALASIDDGFVEGIDEFSSLVEAAALLKDGGGVRKAR